MQGISVWSLRLRKEKPMAWSFMVLTLSMVFMFLKGCFKKNESVTETICKLKYLLSGLYRVCQTLLCEVLCFNFKNSRKSCVLHITYVLVLMDKDVLPDHVPLSASSCPPPGWRSPLHRLTLQLLFCQVGTWAIYFTSLGLSFSI